MEKPIGQLLDLQTSMAEHLIAMREYTHKSENESLEQLQSATDAKMQALSSQAYYTTIASVISALCGIGGISSTIHSFRLPDGTDKDYFAKAIPNACTVCSQFAQEGGKSANTYRQIDQFAQDHISEMVRKRREMEQQFLRNIEETIRQVESSRQSTLQASHSRG